MLVYLKLVLFGQCELSLHEDCPGARMWTDVDKSRRVSVCTCKCHETDVTQVRNKPQEMRK